MHVCTNFRDLRRACPKDNFPTPFINHILYQCGGSEVFLFMDIFSGYNQINIKPKDQHQTAFICPWGTFPYQKMPFGLKNAKATFHWDMTFYFHDLKRIIEFYLDDLSTHSHLRVNQPNHLCLVFERCCPYQIMLNTQKCIFCVNVGR